LKDPTVVPAGFLWLDILMLGFDTIEKWLLLLLLSSRMLFLTQVEPTLTMKNGQPVLTSGKDGFELDEVATKEQLTAAFLEPRKPLAANVVITEPVITPEQAQASVSLAEKAVSEPVTVVASGQSIVIPAQTIAKALSFTREGNDFIPILDGAILQAAIAPELKAVEVPGRDATFRIRQGKPVVVPAVVGSGVSDDELAAKVATVLDASGAARTTTVTLGVLQPALTTEAARELGITTRISTFTQKFPAAAYRSTNIGQAAKYVNGTLLMPGETFSMNDTIKERTVANGYTVGTVIGVGGVFDEQLGGGVSAATTAVWTAAFFAGMEKTDTRAHSLYISRYQPGLEATVAWGIFDMKFTNDTPNAVFITTKMTSTSMTVSFWGTPTYDEILAEFGPRTNIRKPATIYNKSSDCSPQSGIDGFTINVDRVFINDGKEVKRETMTTVYRAGPNVICGKKPKKDEEKGGKNEKKPKKPGAVDPSAEPSPSPSVAVEGDTFENTAASGGTERDKKPDKKKNQKPQKKKDKKQPSDA
jgi:vancomycin resistance protein YoaR